MKKCLVTGSFDPFTIGHFDLVKRAAALFDTVYIAILNNAEKNSCFSKKQRILIAEESTKDIQNVKVISYEGWAIDLAKQLKIDYLVRGIRNSEDCAYESQMADYNKQNGNKETICLFTNPKYAHISSTELKTKLKNKEDIKGYAVDGALVLIERLYKEGGANDKC